MAGVKARILCLDDDEDTCEMLRLLLGGQGYEVIVAATISEGVELVRKNGCDLVLTDLLFSDGNGIELCQRIRAFDVMTPILFCSGAGEPSHIEQARQAGAQGYLVKPCGLEKLERAFAVLLEQRKRQEVNRIAASAVGINGSVPEGTRLDRTRPAQ